jgi:GTP-dependent phosphoenolpyruvate carboxykinase
VLLTTFRIGSSTSIRLPTSNHDLRCQQIVECAATQLFAHWLGIAAKAAPHRLPKIFYVNWFRRGDDDEFLWPGFGENSRILKWALQRIDGQAAARRTPIGYVPSVADLDLTGLNVDRAKIAATLNVSPVEGNPSRCKTVDACWPVCG